MAVNLHLDWCSYKAAKYACEHWHYSQCLPASSLIKIGVWENNIFIGVVIFSHGATYKLLDGYGLNMFEGCELSRIALNKHTSPVSRIIKIAIMMVKKQSPKLRLIVSYADSGKDHIGAIYQATNWIYTGYSVDTNLIVKGKRYHRRSLGSKYGTSSLVKIKQNIDKDAITIYTEPKYKYLYPLDAEMKARIEPLRKPYPKRQKDSSEPSADHAGEGGAAPTLTLQDNHG